MSDHTKPKLVYVGCGHHRMNGFLHVEKNIFKNKSGLPEVLADICVDIPLKNNSVDLIFSRGTLEHLTYREFINHLLICQRILKKGSYIRMVVPDFQAWIKEYENKIYRSDREYNPDLPNENYTDTFVCHMYYHDHYYLHNFDTLSRALKKTGFTNIRECDPGETKVSVASEELLKAETRRYDHVIIEAEKSGANPQIQKFPLPYSRRIILKLLAKYFNIKLVPFRRNGSMFPSKGWFLEKIALLKETRKSADEYLPAGVKAGKPLYEDKLDLKI